MLRVALALSRDGVNWSDEQLAEIDTAASLTVLYPWEDSAAIAWALSTDHLLTFGPAAGSDVAAYGNQMHVRLFSGPDTLELETPVYFLPGCHTPLIGPELLTTYFDIHALAGGDWELTPREDRRALVLVMRDDQTPT